MECELCDNPAVGEIQYESGAILVGCADCILDIVDDPAEAIAKIVDYSLEN